MRLQNRVLVTSPGLGLTGNDLMTPPDQAKSTLNEVTLRGEFGPCLPDAGSTDTDAGPRRR